MYNETYVKNTKRRGTMLDISYYEKTDEIIAQYTCCLLYTSPSPRD